MRLRVSAVQFEQRPLTGFDDFARSVHWAVQVARDAGAQLLCFPEYVTGSLLTLPAPRQPSDGAASGLEAWRYWTQAYLDLFAETARHSGVYILGGTHLVTDGTAWYNQAHLFDPAGNVYTQRKLHLTPYEAEPWRLATGDALTVFDTPIGRLAVLICFDIEFPEAARAAADAGAQILLCPSATDDRAGFWRVRYCAMARAVENQVYVVHSALVGNLPAVRGLEQSYGRSAVIAPCDVPFPPDGIVVEGEWNQPLVVTGDVDLALLDEVRTAGSVTPRLCRRSEYPVRIVSVEPGRPG